LASDYFRGKMTQEKRIAASGIPYTIVRSTQFFEFMGRVADSGAVGQTVHLSTALVQPIAADDVADVMADVAIGAPRNGVREIAGPERVRLVDLVARSMKANKDAREVVADPEARYFGLKLDDRSLVPGDKPRLGVIRFEDWLRNASRK